VCPVDSLHDAVHAPEAGFADAEPAYVHPSGKDLSAPPYGAGLSDVEGQYTAKRALELAADGYNGVTVGPPGSGETMLAWRLATPPAAISSGPHGGPPAPRLPRRGMARAPYRHTRQPTRRAEDLLTA